MSCRTRIVILLGVIQCTMAASGCMGKHIDLVGAGTVELDVVQPLLARISGVTVRQGKQDVHVSGLVQREALSGQPLSGHVDVEVLHPDGRVLERNNVRLPQQRSHRGGRYSEFFHVYIPGRLADGTSVRIRYHCGNHDDASHEPASDGKSNT